MKQPQGKEYKSPHPPPPRSAHYITSYIGSSEPCSMTLQKYQPGKWYAEGQAQDSILLHVKAVTVTQNQC